MRSLNTIPILALALALALLTGCKSGGSTDQASLGSGADSGGAGPVTGGGGDGGDRASDLSWSIREVEFGGTATPAASVTVGGYEAWADGGSKWKAVIPSRLLELDAGEDLELSVRTAEGGRRDERIGIQVQP